MITAWVLFLAYATATAFLAWRGGRDAGSSEGFAVGSGRMHPAVAGVTLGSCLASSATFVLFPGFVYKDGLAALVGFSLPLLAGLATGLVLLAPRFQDVGAEAGALTVPHWLGARFESGSLRSLFAGLQLLNVAYLVLITVGCAYVMERTLGVPYPAAVVGIVGFVFGYTGFGGATAHAFTNTLQGSIMAVVSVGLFLSGMHVWPEAWASVAGSGWTAAESPLFPTSWEVWLVPYGMGIALTTQPHLLSKALYVDGRRQLWPTIAIGLGVFSLYTLVLSVGMYARVLLPADVPQDEVVAAYLAEAIPWEIVASFMAVAILAAAMSTLDGLLVAVAASVGNDLVPGRGSVWLNRAVLVGLAVLTIAISLSPPSAVLILGQWGVYGLVAASAGPLVAGLLYRGRLWGGGAVVSAVLALALYFTPLLLKTLGTDGGVALVSAAQRNPGVAALSAMAVCVPLALVLTRLPSGAATTSTVEA